MTKEEITRVLGPVQRSRHQITGFFFYVSDFFYSKVHIKQW